MLKLVKSVFAHGFGVEVYENLVAYAECSFSPVRNISGSVWSMQESHSGMPDYCTFPKV